MRMRPEPLSGYPGRTYLFYRGRKVFEFANGLSYSTYCYELVFVTQNKLHFRFSSSVAKVEISDTARYRYRLVSELGEGLCNRKSLSLTVGVKNHGEKGGQHSCLTLVSISADSTRMV